MSSDTDVEDFLEHFGIKGMHWGKRKSTESSNSESMPNKSQHNKAKIIGAVTLAVTIGAGAFYANHLLNQRGTNRLGGSMKNKIKLAKDLRLSDANLHLKEEEKKRVTELIKSVHSRKSRDLMSAARFGEIKKDQSDRLRLLNIKQEISRHKRNDQGNLTPADLKRLKTDIVRNYFNRE